MATISTAAKIKKNRSPSKLHFEPAALILFFATRRAIHAMDLPYTDPSFFRLHRLVRDLAIF